MTNKRKLKRYPFRLKVFTQGTGELLGNVEDLHIEGMKVKSKEPISDKKEIQIRFAASGTDEEEKGIVLTACKVWSSFSNEAPRYWYSGLHFIDPSEQALDSIQKLIVELTE